ncbi:hypothetical protein CAL7102_01873 [Dulcicalothrix desertica PCC 7102]|nr:hypothetical protein CAL7102_01873 [Dulcicalothrix desertica PCC 7102]
MLVDFTVQNYRSIKEPAQKILIACEGSKTEPIPILLG